MRDRIIVHIDMDAFFVSVELTEKPWLKDKPVVVAGNSNKRSVVATASYEARKCGVHSAMPLFIAKRLCKDLIVVKANMRKYTVVSEALVKLYNSFCPAVEQFSIDEAFLDLTYTVDNLDEAMAFTRNIKSEIKNKFNLPSTIGISNNKLLSKLASKLGKPNGLFVINNENKDYILKNLPVDKISGIGGKTSQLLFEKFGVRTLGELREIPLMDLYAVFHSYALFLHNASLGIDRSEVVPDYEKPQEKSIGHSITFPFDTNDVNYIKKALKYLSEKVGMRLRVKGLFAESITIVIRYANFHTVSHRKKVFPLNITEKIYIESLTLFSNAYRGGKVRLVGITASNLKKNEMVSLFNENDRYRKIDAVLDKIKLKYGDSAASYGSLVDFEK